MIVAFWVFSLAVAQAVVNKYVLSSRIRFIFSVSVACLSAIPLLIQLFIVVSELRLLPWKYWIKLPLHRFLMSMFGEHGPAINLVVKQHSLRKYDNYDDKRRSLLLSSVTLVAHFTARLLSRVVFNDAFSGMYSMRTTSRGTLLLCDEELKTSADYTWLAIASRLDLLTSNSISSTWRTIPQIIRDLRARREELLVQLNRTFPGRREREKIRRRMNSLILKLRPEQQDKYTSWCVDHSAEGIAWDPPLEPSGKFDWHLLFKLEENFRWEVMRGEKLSLELFKLWNLKSAIILFDPDVFLDLNLSAKAGVTAELGAVARARARPRAGARERAEVETWEDVEAEMWVKAEAEAEVWAGAKAWAKAEAWAEAEVEAWRWQSGTEDEAWAEAWAEVEVRAEARAEARMGAEAGAWAGAVAQQRLWAWAQVGAWMREQLKAQAKARARKDPGPAQAEPRVGTETEMEMQMDVAAEGDKVQPSAEVLVISKVIRNIQLHVKIAPNYSNQKMMCNVRATGSQDGYVSKLYLREFLSSCETENAAEFYNLMESLDETTFILSETPDWAIVDTADIFSCRSLESTISSIIKSGERVVPLKFYKRIIYV